MPEEVLQYEIFPGYLDAANIIERHPNYEARRKRAIPFFMTLEQYVVYCKERAADFSSTNESVEDAQKHFDEALRILNE